MIEIEGKYTCAKIFANTIEDGVIKQTLDVCNHPIFRNAKIRIMPDCHEGKGCTIGFTSTLPVNGEVIPNIVGVDQSCGVLAIKLDVDNDIDFQELDLIVRRHVPSGFDGRSEMHPQVPDELKEKVIRYNRDFLNRDAGEDLKKIGSLGGGNHFISIEKGSTGTYLIIHSGSRNFGNEMARYFHKKALDTNMYSSGALSSLSYLSGRDAEEYLDCAKVCYEYSRISRQIMSMEIMKYMCWDFSDIIETVHNYIGEDKIIRKGAISCKLNEVVLIPLNMRDGTLLCTGKGNEEWNNSGPHGAGRVLSRSKAKDTLSLSDYEDSMKGIWTSCVSKNTLDEAPMAYKDGSEIESLINPAAKIIDHLIPIYNFKG